jgi:hypothetical protein
MARILVFRFKLSKYLLHPDVSNQPPIFIFLGQVLGLVDTWDCLILHDEGHTSLRNLLGFYAE